jgi:alkylhydroperoxidase family enzyme
MKWIRTVSPADATGLLKTIYDTAAARAGKVFHILRIQSLRPRVLQISTQLYLEVMYSSESGLTRAQRELIATAVSAENGCRY